MALTAEVEHLYKIELDQDRVLAMADGTFADMTKLLEHYRGAPLDAGPPVRESSQEAVGATLPVRANRVLQFIERFPAMLRSARHPLVLAVGSSGVLRGFDPRTFDAEFELAKRKVCSVNIGLGSIDSEGMARVCEFIRAQCAQSGVRPELVLYDLDPMLLSVIPPPGETWLTDAHFGGTFQTTDAVYDDFRWMAEEAGAVRPTDPSAGGQPEWQVAREVEIARTFLGDIAFAPHAVQAWLRGCAVLRATGAPVLAIVHPVRRQKLDAISRVDFGPRWRDAERQLWETAGHPRRSTRRSSCSTTLTSSTLNHVNASGRRKLTAQIAASALEELEGKRQTRAEPHRSRR